MSEPKVNRWRKGQSGLSTGDSWSERYSIGEAVTSLDELFSESQRWPRNPFKMVIYHSQIGRTIPILYLLFRMSAFGTWTSVKSNNLFWLKPDMSHPKNQHNEAKT